MGGRRRTRCQALSRREARSQPGDPTAPGGEGPHPHIQPPSSCGGGGAPPTQKPPGQAATGTHLLPAGGWPGTSTGPTASAKAPSTPPTAATLTGAGRPPAGLSIPRPASGPDGVRELAGLSPRPPVQKPARPPARAATCRLSHHFHFPHPSSSLHLPGLEGATTQPPQHSGWSPTGLRRWGADPGSSPRKPGPGARPQRDGRVSVGGRALSSRLPTRPIGAGGWGPLGRARVWERTQGGAAGVRSDARSRGLCRFGGSSWREVP